MLAGSSRELTSWVGLKDVAGIGSGADISIGNGTWIGAASCILPGAQIGEGSVVAAGSVSIGR